MSSTALPQLHAVAPGIVPASRVVRLPAAPTVDHNDVLPPTGRIPASVSNLEQAVGELNRYVAGSRTDLLFRIDEDVGRVVVSIVDSGSGKVLRQMPSEDALRVARYLDSGGADLFRRKA